MPTTQLYNGRCTQYSTREKLYSFKLYSCVAPRAREPRHLDHTRHRDPRVPLMNLDTESRYGVYMSVHKGSGCRNNGTVPRKSVLTSFRLAKLLNSGALVISEAGNELDRRHFGELGTK